MLWQAALICASTSSDDDGEPPAVTLTVGLGTLKRMSATVAVVWS